MGRKGVSKRKPKQDKQSSNANVNSPANGRAGGSSAVQALLRDNRTSLKSDNANQNRQPNKKGNTG